MRRREPHLLRAQSLVASFDRDAPPRYDGGRSRGRRFHRTLREGRSAFRRREAGAGGSGAIPWRRAGRPVGDEAAGVRRLALFPPLPGAGSGDRHGGRAKPATPQQACHHPVVASDDASGNPRGLRRHGGRFLRGDILVGDRGRIPRKQSRPRNSSGPDECRSRSVRDLHRLRRVPEAAVRAMHSEPVDEQGERGGVRDGGLLFSAPARPRFQRVYAASSLVFGLAAACGYGIVRDPPLRGRKQGGGLFRDVWNSGGERVSSGGVEGGSRRRNASPGRRDNGGEGSCRSASNDRDAGRRCSSPGGR